MKKLIITLLVAALCMVAPVAAFDWSDVPSNTQVWINPVTPFVDSYFDITIGNDVFHAWCVDTVNNALMGEPYDADLTTTIGVSAEWNKINWVLNNKGAATAGEVQVAIWTLRGQTIPSRYSAWNTDVAQALVTQADAEYVPECYPAVGAVLIVPSGEYQSQWAIIEIPMPECEDPPAVPEFPTMMIPVFLVGSLMVAASVLKKE